MTSSNLVLGDQDKGEGGEVGKKKKEKKTGPLGPGALLVHSDFSLKLRSLAFRTSNPPENLFAPDDSVCPPAASHRLPQKI